MKKKTLLFFLTVLISQSCNFSDYSARKNGSIDVAIRNEIKSLDDRLFKGIVNNDMEAVKALMSPKLLEKFGTVVNEIVNKFSVVKIDSYTLFDEYAVHSSSTGTLITLPSGNSGDNDYVFRFQPQDKDSYVSMLLLKNYENRFLLTAVYAKYQNQWKLYHLGLGQYSLFGKTAPDYFRLARSSYEKSYLIDAFYNILIANLCLQPAGDLWQFQKENDIKEFQDKITREVNFKYKFPITLTNIESKPQVFKIYPKIENDGFFPMVYYLTNIDLKDTVALKLENEKIQKEVSKIFTGIKQDKKFVFYWAFNELPEEQTKRYEHYGFVEDVIK